MGKKQKKEKEKISKQKNGEADQRKEANYHGQFTRLKSGQFTRPLTVSRYHPVPISA